MGHRSKAVSRSITPSATPSLRIAPLAAAMPETRFLGLEIPFEAQQALRLLPTLDSIDLILDAVLKHLLGQPATADVLKSLQKSTTLDSNALGMLFTGLHWLLRVCMRSSLKPKALTSELTDARVHPPFVETIVKAVEKG